jgi:hypothetical protein
MPGSPYYSFILTEIYATWTETLKERDHWKDLVVDGRMILR